MTSTAHDGGMDEWLRDYHSILDVNLIMMIVELPEEDLAKQDLAICEWIENLRWRNIWEIKWFRPAVCWRHTAINPLDLISPIHDLWQ